MAKTSHIRLAAAVAALLSATPALADQITNFPGGSIHTWTGNHGEDFTVIRSTNTGQTVTTVNRHDGLGPVPFVAPKQKITKKFGGSAYDPDTGRTTTIVVGPNGRGSMIEDGNTLAQHGDMMPRKHKGHSSGSVYDPDTGQTTTIVDGPNGSARMVEDGNTLDDHGDMMMPKEIKGRSSGSAYDPDTGKTTTVIMRPGIYGRMVEDGNTLDKHANMDRRMPRGRASGSVYDPDTNMTTSLSTGPTGWARSVEAGNTLWAH